MYPTPTRWQYTWFSKVAGRQAGFRAPDLNNALHETYQEAGKLGADGWEMVNFTTQWVSDETRKAGHWTVVCFMKRPQWTGPGPAG